MHKTYDINIEMTASINPKVVSNIIVAAVEKQTGRQVSDITIKYDGDKFDGFNITFDSKIKPKADFHSSNKFIATNFDEEY
jgi:hypothetical protein